jgi:hypothetical protein
MGTREIAPISARPLQPAVPRPTLREQVEFLLLVPFNQMLKVACATFSTFLALFETLSPRFLEWAGRTRARAAFYQAARRVPGYAHFLSNARYQDGLPPETDK